MYARYSLADCDVSLFQTRKTPIKIAIRVVAGETIYEADLAEAAITYNPACICPVIDEIFNAAPQVSLDSHAMLTWAIELSDMSCIIEIKVPRQKI